MRNATSSDGEYLPSSMALTVCRVTPILSASSCCVISLRSKRSRRMLLTMVFAMSRVAAGKDDLRAESNQQRGDDRSHHAVGHQETVGARQMHPDADRQKRADEQDVERDSRRSQVDQMFAFVFRRPGFFGGLNGDRDVQGDFKRDKRGEGPPDVDHRVVARVEELDLNDVPAVQTAEDQKTEKRNPRAFLSK